MIMKTFEKTMPTLVQQSKLTSMKFFCKIGYELKLDFRGIKMDPRVHFGLK